MKIVHIESGLGNQMLSYCEYLAIKKVNPQDECYLETIVYDLPVCNDVICQWYGYELNRIFGINAPNIREILSEEQWTQVICNINKSKFWEKNWNWPVYFCDAFKSSGLTLKNCRGDFEASSSILQIGKNDKLPFSYRIKQTGLYERLRHQYKVIRRDKCESDDKDNLFFITDEDCLLGQRLTFKNIGSGIEQIEKEVRESFVFPNFSDERNVQLMSELLNCESVAIHARRGDMLNVSGKYYRSGYFNRAVKLIKSRIQKPVFYFFCDPGSIEWCKQNLRIFGLDLSRDSINFVDWNSGETSYCDMQLMSTCKHNIITNSSFGWWGAYLNLNPGKITISPEYNINTTYHC